MTKIFVLSLLSTIFSVCLYGQSAAREKALEYLMEGDRYLQHGNWEDAMFAYTNAINTDQTYAAAYMKRARLYEALNRYKDAKIDYNYAIRLNPYSDFFYDSRALVKTLDMDYEGAESDFAQALSINPNSIEVRAHKVDNYIAFKQYEKALEELDSIESLGGQRATVFEKRAIVCYLKKDFECANNMADSLVKLDTLKERAYDLKGIALLEEGMIAQSIEYFNWAIKEDPNFYLAYYNRGLAFKKQGNHAKAIEDFNHAISLNKGIENIYLARARSKNKLGDKDGALEDYTKSLNNDTEANEIALYDRTFVNKVLGNYEAALRDAELLVEKDPYNPQYRNALGNVYLLYGDYYKAIDSYTEAISYDMDFAKAYYNRGIAYVMTNQSRQGCLDLQYSSQMGNKKAQEMMLYLCGN